MEKNRSLLIYIIAFVIASSLFSCSQNNNTLTDAQSQAVKDSVLKLADMTSNDISTKGPIAWLNHFEDSPGFFMASGGSLVFPDYHKADSYIKNKLVKLMPKVTLKWSHIRVDPLTPQIAVMAADFHEDITDIYGEITPYNGYFTATVHKTEKGWKFRDEHWSMKPGK